MLKLSIIIPVYNEHKTLQEIVQRVREVELVCQIQPPSSALTSVTALRPKDMVSNNAGSGDGGTTAQTGTLPAITSLWAAGEDEVALEREVIIVDDGSTDGTREILDEWRQDLPMGMRIIYHQKNGGKGAALRTAFQHATGDIFVIQDADLEYDPRDFVKLLEPILEGRTSVVYGSRFLGGARSAMSLTHELGNKGLTILTNLIYGTFLSDMETCYKCFTRDVIHEMPLHSRRFEIEPELTAKILKRGYTIFEVPIRYHGRAFHEGKKISWRDGFITVYTLFKYRFVD